MSFCPACGNKMNARNILCLTCTRAVPPLSPLPMGHPAVKAATIYSAPSHQVRASRFRSSLNEEPYEEAALPGAPGAVRREILRTVPWSAAPALISSLGVPLLFLWILILSSALNAQIPGLATFRYPGTNFPTQLVAINDNGAAVGWFIHPLRGALCDPAAFGGPCPPGDQTGDAVKVPYAFSYFQGKFKRLRGPLVEAPNNKPIAINNRGQVLILHGKLTNYPGLYTYLVYDLTTGTTRNIGTGGKGAAADGGEGLIMATVKPAGLNDKDEVVGPGQAIERLANAETKHEYGLAIGTANIYPLESNPDSVTSIFRQFQVSLQSCPKQESNLQYVGHMQFAGPNDAGQVAISCDKDAVIFSTNSGRSTPFSATDPDYLIKVSGISNSGSVVGCAMQPGKKPFVYGSGKFSLLPIPDENSCILGINVKGQIVGFSGDNTFIYSPQS